MISLIGAKEDEYKAEEEWGPPSNRRSSGSRASKPDPDAMIPPTTKSRSLGWGPDVSNAKAEMLEAAAGRLSAGGKAPDNVVLGVMIDQLRAERERTSNAQLKLTEALSEAQQMEACSLSSCGAWAAPTDSPQPSPGAGASGAGGGAARVAGGGEPQAGGAQRSPQEDVTAGFS